jgi:hypothetical protein
MDWLDQHSGTVTAFASVALALITVGYVLLTRSLAVSSARLLRETAEANDLARQANLLALTAIDAQTAERVRRQASRFSAWPSGQGVENGVTFGLVAFRNLSSEPFFECTFTLSFELRGSSHSQTQPIIRPELVDELRIPIGAAAALADTPLLRFEFTDNAGRRWSREPRGELTQIGDPAPRDANPKPQVAADV